MSTTAKIAIFWSLMVPVMYLVGFYMGRKQRN